MPARHGPPLPPPTGETKEWQRRAQAWMKEANNGKIPVTGTVTLNVNSNTTLVYDTRVNANSRIALTPLTPSAGVEHMRVVIVGRGKGYFILEHTNNSETERTFSYAVTGV